MPAPARLARWVAFVAITGLAAWLLAGRTDIPRLWALLGLYWGVMLLGMLTLSPELTRERLRRGQKTADPAILAALRGFTLAHILAGILDVARWHWTDTVPVWLSALGFLAAAAAFVFALTAVRANRFFVPSVRIQEERGHHLIDTGPYRLVRHPGYAGMLIASPASGLLIGSWLSFGLGLCAAGVFALRAFKEDAFLQKNLPGYPEYSGKTRFRLVPGLF